MSDLGIRIGAAGNQAALVLEGAWRAIADGKATVEQISTIHADLTANFVQTMNDLEAAGNLATAFPGTTVASPAETQAIQAAAVGVAPGPFDQPSAAVVQFPQQPQVAFAQATQAPAFQQQGGFQPVAQAPGTTHKDDAAWQRLFANPSGYYDNRQSKKSPSGPDFKSKQDDKDALWLQGKFGPAPQWVFDRLQGGYGPVQ